MNSKKTIYDKNTIEFATVAVQYCSLIEQVATREKADFVDKSLKILPLLYLKASLLPTLEKDEYAFQQRHVTEEQYERVRAAIGSLLGREDAYLEVLSLIEQAGEEVVADAVSESLADIYQDVRDFVANYGNLDNEQMMTVALSTCQDAFANYWGQRLVSVMRALHAIKYNDCSSDETIDEPIPDEDDF